ncbi:ALF repeat-containing protein [Crossiella sp. S99.2]|nr:ALF repeat-containing protein [Crossiella sp. S99.2]MCK2258407.1 ALF repeat-containing protein [Crossiella sp. S99.1]
MHNGGSATRDAGNRALNGTDADRTEFLLRGQHIAAEQDNRIRVAQLMTAGKEEVKAAGAIALEGPPSMLADFLQVEHLRAQRRDQDTAAHEARVKGYVADAARFASTAGADAAEAQRVAAVANKAAEAADEYKRQAAASAAQAQVHADDAARSARDAEASAAQAAQSAKDARAAAASAQRASWSADSSAAAASTSAAQAKASAASAADSAASARASAEEANEHAAAAAKAASDALESALAKEKAASGSDVNADEDGTDIGPPPSPQQDKADAITEFLAAHCTEHTIECAQVDGRARDKAMVVTVAKACLKSPLCRTRADLEWLLNTLATKYQQEIKEIFDQGLDIVEKLSDLVNKKAFRELNERVRENAPETPPLDGWLDARALTKVPDTFGLPGPTKKGVGVRWFDEKNPRGNFIRIDKGNPASDFPSQRVDHVRITDNGRLVDRNGNKLPQGTKVSDDGLATHIPLEEWLQWKSWNEK